MKCSFIMASLSALLLSALSLSAQEEPTMSAVEAAALAAADSYSLFQSSDSPSSHPADEKGRDPGKAFYLSLILPGSGQIYNGKFLKAVLYAGADAYLIGSAYVNQGRYEDSGDLSDRDERNKYLWWGAGTWLLGALDAYVDAHLSLFPDENIRLSAMGTGQSASISLNFHF